MLLRHKCQAEIEKAIDKVKLGAVSVRKRTKMDQCFRRQWYRAMMRDKKRADASWNKPVSARSNRNSQLGLILNVKDREDIIGKRCDTDLGGST